MKEAEIIEKTTEFVKKTLADAEGGHDWFHIERVLHNAQLIAKGEKVDDFIVALGALLHDIADAKFHNGDETIGPKKATEFLLTLNVDKVIIEHIIKIIENISFKNSLSTDKNSFTSKE
ncbi:MAG: HD domain-containing protein, partial [Flavobacteriaceae bacterium]|nr:HD domain-containing protein [Flavobacteriaceae bacterium]